MVQRHAEGAIYELTDTRVEIFHVTQRKPQASSDILSDPASRSTSRFNHIHQKHFFQVEIFLVCWLQEQIEAKLIAC